MKTTESEFFDFYFDYTFLRVRGSLTEKWHSFRKLFNCHLLDQAWLRLISIFQQYDAENDNKNTCDIYMGIFDP